MYFWIFIVLLQVTNAGNPNVIPELDYEETFKKCYIFPCATWVQIWLPVINQCQVYDIGRLIWIIVPFQHSWRSYELHRFTRLPCLVVTVKFQFFVLSTIIDHPMAYQQDKITFPKLPFPSTRRNLKSVIRRVSCLLCTLLPSRPPREIFGV